MKRILSFISENILFLLTLFLLVFIPLYPKLPLLDITQTWVYIRIEDFIMAVVWVVFFVQLLRKKATLNTPLTLPIVGFWLVGAIATLHGVLFLFPHLRDVFPHLALLYWLRHVEYASVFFLAYSAMRKKNFINPLIITLAVTLILVFLYGLGQRYLGFPAFLTMNEEFAKGIPLRLSPLARIPSTFAGHYDLAAYLALLIPIMGSMVIGFKKWYAKLFFFFTAVAGLILLLMTASRVSYGVYLISITLLLILHKQKRYILPVLIASIILLQAFPGITSRFASTFQQVDLVVDSRSGKAIGVASEMGDGKVVIQNEQSTGENLPTGTKYIDIPTQNEEGKQTQIVYKTITQGSKQPVTISRAGKVIVKKAFAYDVSFTTRFQGEWPRAIEALQRNYLLGSGYSAINLATDNNYLRMLGETGVLGFASFLFIFLITAIYLWRVLPEVTDKKTRALIYGTYAGLLGVGLNAVLIDVFEASKLAFVMWLVLGATVGLAKLYQAKSVAFLKELRAIALSRTAGAIYLVATGSLVFARSLTNYFVADDFTWLRWAADCSTRVHKTCESLVPTILSFFSNAQGFYYRPGMKTLFYLAYPVFEIFPTPYHLLSLLAHLAATVLIFFLSRKFLKSTVYGFLTALLFLLLSAHFENLYWVSTLGHVISSVCILAALLSFVYYRETKLLVLLILSYLLLLVATFFHEFAIVGVLLIIAYDLIERGREGLRGITTRYSYLLLITLIPLYYIMRSISHSLWFSGDYSYNIVKLPFNFVGNLISYVFLTLFSNSSLSYLQDVRTFASSHLLLSGVISILIAAGLVIGLRNRDYHKRASRVFLLSIALFVIPLLPFLGLGNIAPRYTYLSSFGICLLLIYFAKTGLDLLEKGRRKQFAVGLAVIYTLYLISNVISLWSLNSDWQKAGDLVNNALVDITLNNATDTQNDTNAKSTFYFVNVPIRYRSAWVFPVGLTDAIWFSFKDTDVISIPQEKEADAQLEADKNKSVKVFKFLPDGSVVEYSATTITPQKTP